MLVNNIEEASTNLLKAKEIDPSIASIGWNETRLLIKQKKVQEALVIAQKTNKLFPNDGEGIGVLGSCLRANGNLDEGLKYLNKAIELNPSYTEALINRGLIKITQDDKESALSDLEKAHHQKPHITKIWHLILNLKMEIKDFEDIIPLAEKMVKLDPLDHKIIANIALKLFEVFL